MTRSCFFASHLTSHLHSELGWENEVWKTYKDISRSKLYPSPLDFRSETTLRQDFQMDQLLYEIWPNKTRGLELFQPQKSDRNPRSGSSQRKSFYASWVLHRWTDGFHGGFGHPQQTKRHVFFWWTNGFWWFFFHRQLAGFGHIVNLKRW